MDGLVAVGYSVHNSRVNCTGPVWPFADRCPPIRASPCRRADGERVASGRRGRGDRGRTAARAERVDLGRQRHIAVGRSSGRGVVDGIKAVIHQTRTPEKGPPRRPDGTRPRLRRTGVKLTRVITHILGVSGRAILTALIAGESREDASSVLDIADRDLPDCPSARNALRFRSDTDAQELWGQGPLPDVNCGSHVRGYFVSRQGIATSAEGRILIGARCGVWAVMWAGYGPAPRQRPVESTEHHDCYVADAAQDVG